MKLGEIEEKIWAMREFKKKGGPEKGVSFPLFRETSEGGFIVHMVYEDSAYAPSGLVITKLSDGEPVYYGLSDGLKLLGMKADDFKRSGDVDREPARDPDEMNEYTVDSFYHLVSQPDFDRDIYAGYVYSILPFLEPRERMYYKAFI